MEADIISSTKKIRLIMNAQGPKIGAKTRVIKVDTIIWLDRILTDNYCELYFCNGQALRFTVDEINRKGYIRINKIDTIAVTDNADLFTKLNAVI